MRNVRNVSPLRRKAPTRLQITPEIMNDDLADGHRDFSSLDFFFSALPHRFLLTVEH